MAGRWLVIGALMSAPLATLGAQSLCLGVPTSARVAWPAPLDRQVTLGAGVLGVREAIERAAAAAHVHFTYEASLLPRDRTVCTGSGLAGRARLGDWLTQWLDGTRLKPVVAGGDRIVLAPTRQVALQTPAGVPGLALAQLEPVVVVEHAQRPADPAENATVSRTVVTAEQLDAMGVPSLAQALSGAVPGFWMWAPSPAAIGGGVASLRGASSFGANYPKVYVDGIEVANPLFLSQLATDQVAQVEVIRGPQGSSLYGAGAIGGVINITTRAAVGQFDGRRVSLRSTAGLAESSYSPLGAFVQDHALSAQAGDLTHTAGIGISTSTIGAFIPGAFSQQLHSTAGAGFVGARSRVQLTARFFAQRAGNATSPLLSSLPLLTTARAATGSPGREAETASVPVGQDDSTAAQDVREYTVGAAWGLQLPHWSHTMVVGADGYRLNNVALIPGQLRTPGDSALLAASGAADRASVRWSSSTELGTRDRLMARLTLGADHSALRDASLGTSPEHPSDQVSPVWRHTTGVNANADMSITRSLALNGGIRFERNAGFTVLSGFTALPSVGAAYRRRVGAAAITLRTAYGKAISPPRVSTRALPWGGRVPSVLALQPEEQSGIELGADVNVGSRFSARITRYDQRATNLVQPVAQAGDDRGRSIAFRLQNVGAIANRGWEAEGNLGVGALTLTGSLGLTDSRVQRVATGYSGDLRAGDRVLQIPARTLSVGATWLGRGWSASGTLARASNWTNYDWLALSTDLADPGITTPHGSALRSYWRTYTGVTRLRAAFARDITPAFGLVFSGDNLLNYQSGEPDNVTIVPGRTLRAGLRARF